MTTTKKFARSQAKWVRHLETLIAVEIKEMLSGASEGKYFVIRQLSWCRLQMNRNGHVDHVGESEAAREPLAHPNMEECRSMSMADCCNRSFEECRSGPFENCCSSPFEDLCNGSTESKGKGKEITEDASDSESSVRQYLTCKTACGKLWKVKAKLFTQRALAACLEEEIENLDRRC
jgi:hypothetical protein